jgi:ATP-dependent DNA ligase
VDRAFGQAEAEAARVKDRSHPLAETEPMEAKLVDALPAEGGWQYEPKWDGFRAIASRAGDHVELMSKSGKSLARYFPEIVSALMSTACREFVLDGELILPINGVLSFDVLQARLHSAESRIRRLSAETPAQLMLFDCLALDDKAMIDRPLADRRAALERFHVRDGTNVLRLSPCVLDLQGAEAWLAASGGALDGVIAKRLDEAYRPGDRAMLKVKQHRTADCVVGGFRRTKDGPLVASLLLGLYDDAGLLHHVGFTSALAKQDRAELTARLEALSSPPGFTGRAPGGPSRWNDGKESIWYPLRPELVVEVSYDQVTSDRFRHGTGLLRWRPDKAPRQCSIEQLDYALRPSDLADVG